MLRQLLFMAMAFVLANTSFADHGIQAINGHTMELDGDVMIVQGTSLTFVLPAACLAVDNAGLCRVLLVRSFHVL